MTHETAHSNDSLYDRHAAHESMAKVFRDGSKAMDNADLDKPVKLFGLFEVDAGLAAYGTIAYNTASDYIGRILDDRAYNITKRFATPHMSQSAALKTAALTTTALNVVLKSGGFVMPMVNSYKEHNSQLTTLARRVAPVLDEEQGKHSVGTLKKVSKTNTVLSAHLKRMDKKYGAERFNNMIDLVLNAGPNIALNYKDAKQMWNGKNPGQIATERKAATAAAAQAAAEVTNTTPATPGGEIKEMGRLFMQGGTAAFTDRLKRSNTHKLNKTLRPYSALEMILTLDDQFQGNAKARSYQVPGKRGESYGLEEYIARVVIHHYAEMADISSEHSEIREALHEDLAKAVKPLADAMRKGELSAMDLIQLVGEEKIVHKGGRVIASAEEIEELLGKEHAQGLNRPHQSPEEHYAHASYNREEFKKALHSLSGDQKRIFASWFSNEVLEDAGMKAEEIKAMREATAKARDGDKAIAEGVLGVTADGAEAMRKEGGASAKEIGRLNEASAKIEQDGVDAVHDLRSSNANPNGIEQTVANVAVTKILGDKSYFGTMLDKGQSMLESMNAQPAR